MDEVPDEVQAAMHLKLMDGVSELVRKEIKKALEDYSFYSKLELHHLAGNLMGYLKHDHTFHKSIREMLVERLRG